MKNPFTRDKLRMAQWLFFAALFYAFAAYVAYTGIVEIRQAGVVAQKLGNVTLSAFIGYWIDRNAFKNAGTDQWGGLRRAFIIAGAMLAVSGGI